MSRFVLLAAVTVLTLVGTACGGEDADDPSSAPGGAQTAPGPAPGRSPLALPPGVPRRGTAPAVRSQVRVIRRWADTLRSGDVEGAARLWAVPARAQNATPLLRLDSPAGVLAFNEGLTCGAKVVAARRAGAYTIAKLRLTTRPGGDPGCRAFEGAPARIAVRLRGGRIAEWYRLPEQPSAPDGDPGPAPGAPGTPI